MRKIANIYLQQTQGRRFESVENRFEELLYKNPLTEFEEDTLVKEVESEDFDGIIHQKLYALHDKVLKQISEEEAWGTDYRYVEDGLCVSVLLSE